MTINEAIDLLEAVKKTIGCVGGEQIQTAIDTIRDQFESNNKFCWCKDCAYINEDSLGDLICCNSKSDCAAAYRNKFDSCEYCQKGRNEKKYKVRAEATVCIDFDIDAENTEEISKKVICEIDKIRNLCKDIEPIGANENCITISFPDGIVFTDIEVISE